MTDLPRPARTPRSRIAAGGGRSFAKATTVYYAAHRYSEAIAAFNRSLLLDPHGDEIAAIRGFAYLMLGEFATAREACTTRPLDWIGNTCLAVVYHKLHRHSDADAALAAVVAERGDDAAFQYAGIYAQWGNIPKALQWLETAYRLRDSGSADLKVDPLLDPLRQNPGD